MSHTITQVLINGIDVTNEITIKSDGTFTVPDTYTSGLLSFVYEEIDEDRPWQYGDVLKYRDDDLPEGRFMYLAEQEHVVWLYTLYGEGGWITGEIGPYFRAAKELVRVDE